MACPTRGKTSLACIFWLADAMRRRERSRRTDGGKESKRPFLSSCNCTSIYDTQPSTILFPHHLSSVLHSRTQLATTC